MLTRESIGYYNELQHNLKLIKSNNLKKLFTKLDSVHYDYETPEISLVEDSIYPTMDFIPENLLQKAKKHTNKIVVEWVVNSTKTIDCKLNLYQKGININHSRINLLVYIISYIVSLSDNHRIFTIHLVLLPDKKLFNKKFIPNEINSGVCSYNSEEATVYVYRKEECIKVLIHEIIHGLSFSDIDDTPRVINHYNEKYSIESSRMTLNETYTEIWAKLINCYLIVKLINETPSYREYQRLVSLEKKFSLIQATKIMNHLESLDEKIDLNHATNPLAYYLAINELFQIIDLFLEFKFKNKNVFYLKKDIMFNNLLLNYNQKPRINKFSTLFDKTFRMTAMELKV